MIDGQIVRDLEEPARKFEFRAVAIEVVEDLDERLLREVFRGLAIAHHSEDERKNGPLISREKLAVCRFRSLSRQLDDFRIG